MRHRPLLVFLMVGVITTTAALFGTGNPAGVDNQPRVRNTVTSVVVVTAGS